MDVATAFSTQLLLEHCLDLFIVFYIQIIVQNRKSILKKLPAYGHAKLLVLRSLRLFQQADAYLRDFFRMRFQPKLLGRWGAIRSLFDVLMQFISVGEDFPRFIRTEFFAVTTAR